MRHAGRDTNPGPGPEPLAGPYRLHYGSAMGELRLYAIGIDEVRGMFGARPDEAQRLREIAARALEPEPVAPSGGLLSRLGPIFRRPPGAPVISPTQPQPADLEALLAGDYIPPERVGATWRLLEILVAGSAWGSTKMELTARSLDDLDFALARGGVSSAVGLRHLLNSSTSVSLVPVQGLMVGYHPYPKALGMASAYRSAMPEIKDPAHQELVSGLVTWLDGFVHWAEVAQQLGRPTPDLVGFWVS